MQALMPCKLKLPKAKLFQWFQLPPLPANPKDQTLQLLQVPLQEALKSQRQEGYSQTLELRYLALFTLSFLSSIDI
ncbi:hypothetical protein A2U01_0063123 [Trifolium medium]|uniref:Uncharacterized protein n=1 Tax=Trifolium medium TaxID=97028 RepID=A0A392RZQ3_9FABA|nr:hypothetical protein [Trifolium medium]